MINTTPEQIAFVLYAVALAGFIVCVLIACMLIITTHL